MRGYGSAGVEFGLIACGKADARISSRQKAHEDGLGYLLMKESGGTLIGHDGSSFDNKPYNFDAFNSVIAAATPELAEEILKAVNKAS